MILIGKLFEGLFEGLFKAIIEGPFQGLLEKLFEVLFVREVLKKDYVIIVMFPYI